MKLCASHFVGVDQVKQAVPLATDLYPVAAAQLLELGIVLGQMGKTGDNIELQPAAQAGRVDGEKPVGRVPRKNQQRGQPAQKVFYFLAGLPDPAAVLDRFDNHVVGLVDPHGQGAVLVVVDTPSQRPLAK